MNESRGKPATTVEHFLDERRPEVAEQTQYNNQGHLLRFIEFTEDKEIEQMQELDGFLLRQFKTWLRNNRNVNEVTVSNYVSTIRAFVKWCEKVELVEEGLYEKMDYPHLSIEEQTRDVSIDPEEADAILGYCYKFEYATLRHTMFHLAWHTTFRLGTIYSLDLSDWHSDGSYLSLHHRAETGTPLKNGQAAEREVNINGELAEVLNDYIRINRHDVTDEEGREPLLTTKNGRAYDSLLRKHINALTRPCHYTGDCPHGRDQSECEATNYNQASKCPSSVSPHPVRRSATTYHLNNGWPTELVSERANVSPDVLEKHYDVRSKEEKRQNRREHLDKL